MSTEKDFPEVNCEEEKDIGDAEILPHFSTREGAERRKYKSRSKTAAPTMEAYVLKVASASVISARAEDGQKKERNLRRVDAASEFF